MIKVFLMILLLFGCASKPVSLGENKPILAPLPDKIRPPLFSNWDFSYSAKLKCIETELATYCY
jgi:hypothetical protein